MVQICVRLSLGYHFLLLIPPLWAKTLWAAVKCWFQPLGIMTDHFGHLMAHIFTLWNPREGACSQSLLACVCGRSVVLLGMCSPGNGEQCERVCSELLCCGSDTSRHRERSVPDIWRRGAGKRWHWGVMKKCLCVRGLKNSPFKVVCLLAEQRQGSVSEICCKDYLVCILYQGTANRIFFLRPALAVPHLLRKDSSFLCIPPLGPRSSLAPFALHSSSHLSLPENTSYPWAKKKRKRIAG